MNSFRTLNQAGIRFKYTLELGGNLDNPYSDKAGPTRTCTTAYSSNLRHKQPINLPRLASHSSPAPPGSCIQDGLPFQCAKYIVPDKGSK